MFSLPCVQIKVASETLDKNRQRIESRGKSKEEVSSRAANKILQEEWRLTGRC